MSDFTTPVGNVMDGHFPRHERKPAVSVRPDGQIGIFVGAAYQYVSPDYAADLVNQLAQAVETARHHRGNRS